MITNVILNIEHSILTNTFGWKLDEGFDSGRVKTIEWYLSEYEIQRNIR